MPRPYRPETLDYIYLRHKKRMTTKNIQDVVAEKVDNLPYHTENTPGTTSNIRYYTRDTVVKALAQLVKEVEAGERERIIEVIKEAHALEHPHDTEDYGLGFQGACSYLWNKLTPPTSDEALQDNK